MRIATFISDTGSWGSVNFDTLEKGLGGRETAALQLSAAWAELGHEAWLFAPNDNRETYHSTSGGQLQIVDKNAAIPLLTSLDWDLLVSWEDPRIFAVDGVREMCQVMVCGMQVAHIIHDDPELLRMADCWVALSPWHREFLSPQLPRGTKVAVMPNGTDLSRFEGRGERVVTIEAKINPPEGRFLRFLYASSPDRGLVHLLRAWPKIREEFPGAMLDVVYGAKDWAERNKWSHHIHGEIALDILEGLVYPGVCDRGKVGAKELAALHLRSDGLLYPCDTIQPTETGCITIIEALAAGSPVVTTDADCLASEFEGLVEIVPLPWDEDAYVERVVEVFSDAGRCSAMGERGHEWVKAERDWSLIAPHWIDLAKRLGQRDQVLATA